MTVPASLYELRDRLASCLDDVADDDTYAAKRWLANRRRDDEYCRVARARREA
jgi:hypothetical protein